MEAYLSNLTVFNHPLIKHKVSHLCDVNTGTKEFSELVKEPQHPALGSRAP